MNDLMELQNKFQAYLLNSENTISHHIVKTKKVPIATRLSIYGHAYQSRLLDALATTYPIMQTFLGEEQFNALANAYLTAHPSHYRSIRWFGDQLAEFLKIHSPFRDLPYLAELAQVEWIMTLVFDAANCDTLTLSALSTVPGEAWVDMRLTVHPSTHLLKLKWNVIPIWQAITEKKVPIEVSQQESPTTWIFWRHELTSHYCLLAAAEASAIEALLKGATFGEICEELCAWWPEHEVGMHAASLLKGWISSGLIADLPRLMKTR